MKTYHQFIPSKTSTNNVDGGQDKLDGLSYWRRLHAHFFICRCRW
jgi:hypothetical protein